MIFLDAVQQEPVMVTRDDKPIGVMVSIEALPTMANAAERIQQAVRASVARGSADVKAGRTHRLTDAYIDTLKAKARERISQLPAP